MPEPIHAALQTSGHYERPHNTQRVSEPAAEHLSGIAIDRIDGMPDIATKAKIYKVYQNTWWEFESGEERIDHENRFNDFLKRQKNLTTLVAHKSQSKEAVGILYAYDNPMDHPLETRNYSRLAGVAVSENYQKREIGTRLVKAHNQIFSQLGSQGLVLAYDEPGEKLYKRFSMQPTDEMRVKVKDIVPLSEKTSTSNVRCADLREPRDAKTVFSFERARPQYAVSPTSTADAARFWLAQPDHNAWIAEHPYSKVPEGAALAAEWNYPVAKTWVPQYLKMMTIPGIRTGTLDRSSDRIEHNSGSRRNQVAAELLEQALAHAKNNDFTNVRVADPEQAQQVFVERGFSVAPVLYKDFPISARHSQRLDNHPH